MIEKLYDGFDWMLVVTQDVSKSSLLPRLQGQLCLFRTRHSIETCYGHIEDPLYSFMNHSFTPTAHVAPDGTVTLLQDLKIAQEVTSNYLQHETIIAFPFEDLNTGKYVYK